MIKRRGPMPTHCLHPKDLVMLRSNLKRTKQKEQYVAPLGPDEGLALQAGAIGGGQQRHPVVLGQGGAGGGAVCDERAMWEEKRREQSALSLARWWYLVQKIDLESDHLHKPGHSKAQKHAVHTQIRMKPQHSPAPPPPPPAPLVLASLAAAAAAGSAAEPSVLMGISPMKADTCKKRICEEPMVNCVKQWTKKVCSELN